MTIGHYPDRVLAILAFSALLLVGLYFCSRKGVIPGTIDIRRDTNPRIFAVAIAALTALAIIAAFCALAIYFGYGLDLAGC